METMHHNFAAAPPPHNATAGGHIHHRRMLMHMTFYWGTCAEVLFSGWPGSNRVMYAMALVFVFTLAVLVEWFSRCNLIKPGANRVGLGFFRAGLHAVRIGFTYMLMLALISFNGGVFIAAVSGHAVGFLLFGSRVLGKGSG
ncbi:copper transporter 1 [Actinidia rufa]|uniref:Copper transport protein n=1 Tax=Actinidia rufa TaxID=165716 RepID=A0A7J0F3F5_9ERIC|nr:copper transporter 1 [Actinidia rufa]